MFLQVNFDLPMINAKNGIEETKNVTETFFQKFIVITLKRNQECPVRRDNFDPPVKDLEMQKKLLLAKDVSRECSHSL